MPGYAPPVDGTRRIDISPDDLPDARMCLEAALRTAHGRRTALDVCDRQTWPAGDRQLVTVHNAAEVLRDGTAADLVREIAKLSQATDVRLHLRFRTADCHRPSDPTPTLAAFGDPWLRARALLGDVEYCVEDLLPALV